MTDVQKSSSSYPNPAASSPRGQQQPQQDTRPPSNEIGKEHELLKRTAGRFKAECTYTCGGEEAVYQGEATREVILDGRFLLEKFKGTFGGKPFEGTMLIGFADGQFQVTWADSTCNRVYIAKGGFVQNSDSEIDTFSQEPYKESVTGRMKTTRERHSIHGDDEIVYESYDRYLDEGEREHRTMRVVLRRM